MPVYLNCMAQNQRMESLEEIDSIRPLTKNNNCNVNSLDDNMVWDTHEALQRVEEDHVFLREIVELFLACSGELLANLKQNLAAKDAEAVRMTAHALKGSAAELSAKEMLQAARRLEEAGRNGNIPALAVHGQLLEEAALRLNKVLRAWLSS
ncbi:MAG: Hpt domain-containing protein [Gammaproteobacteria bacterium]|jgi:HPt (histidine-containing phosphotransfer) domain-containing protein